jgi:hypothetical protein
MAVVPGPIRRIGLTRRRYLCFVPPTAVADEHAKVRCAMVIPFVQSPYPKRPAPAGQRAQRDDAPSEPIALVGNTDPWSWLLAASLKIDLWRLARFNELMATHRMPIHLGRMFRDPAYAFERLSLGHGTGNAELKELALEMFEQYLTLERRRRSPDSNFVSLPDH